MKKIFIPVFLIVVLLLTSMPAMAWQRGGGYYRGSRGPGVGGIIGGLIVGGLIAGTVAAATRPPVQVVQQPAYAPEQPGGRMCSEERRVTGEYQYDAHGNQVWVEFAQPVVRNYQVPCP
jgi:hypothetical protein